MKKMLFLFVCLFTLHTVARADGDKLIQINQMPKQAQLFIHKYFSDGKIALAKMESNLLNKSYEVIFTNGSKVEFDKKGQWKEVDCKYSAVPEAIVPAPILKHVKDNYADNRIIKLERDKKEYEIKLSDRTELKFNQNFKLIDVDI